MCGMCGVYNTLMMSSEVKFFKGLLFLNVMRGEDATGLIKITQNKGKAATIFRYKDTKPSYDMLKDKEACRVIEDTANGEKNIALLGHTRAATTGKLTKENAHPFNFPKVLGMHNGTITGNFENRRSYGTDSEALYSRINELGIEDALSEIHEAGLESVAYALQYYDKAEKSLKFIRNDKRPLCFGVFDNERGLAWSSEARTLEFAADKRDVTFDSSCFESALSEGLITFEEDGIFQPKPGVLMTLKIGDKASEVTFEKLDLPPLKTRPVKHGSYISYGSNYGGFGGWGDWDRSDYETYKSANSRTYLRYEVDRIWKEQSCNACGAEFNANDEVHTSLIPSMYFGKDDQGEFFLCPSCTSALMNYNKELKVN